jgi:hypothetical protein
MEDVKKRGAASTLGNIFERLAQLRWGLLFPRSSTCRDDGSPVEVNR